MTRQIITAFWVVAALGGFIFSVAFCIRADAYAALPLIAALGAMAWPKFRELRDNLGGDGDE